MEEFKKEIVEEVNELLERFEKLKAKLEKGPRKEIDIDTIGNELEKYDFDALNNGTNIKLLGYIDLDDKDKIAIGDKVYKKNKGNSMNTVYYTMEIPFEEKYYDFIVDFINSLCSKSRTKENVEKYGDDDYNFDIYIDDNADDKHKCFDLEKDQRFFISNKNNNAEFIKTFIKLKKQKKD